MDLRFLKSAAAQAASYAVALRREIHSHPELSDREEQTSALVCRELERLNIPVSVLHALADFYNVSIDYLLGRTNEKQPYPKK